MMRRNIHVNDIDDDFGQQTEALINCLWRQHLQRIFLFVKRK